MAMIEDGAGGGNSTRVDISNRLHTLAISKPDTEFATENADSYNLNSGLITLTDSSEQGILYIKNNETRNLHITGIVAILGPSTNGVTTDTTHIRFYKNPTTGTLISEASAANVSSNRNFGSSKTLSADIYKGDGTATITDGSVHIESLVNPGNRVFFGIDEILTKGDAIGVTYEPNDSNSSMKVMAAVICHLQDLTEKSN